MTLNQIFLDNIPSFKNMLFKYIASICFMSSSGVYVQYNYCGR